MRICSAVLVLAACQNVPPAVEDDDAGFDAGKLEDAGVDAGVAVDAGLDAGLDAGPTDAGRRWAWTARFGDALPQVGLRLASRPSGATAIAGFAAGYVDFGHGMLGHGDLSGSLFIAALEPNAPYTPRWSRAFGGAGTQEVGALAFGPDGSLVVAGRFSGELGFDGGTLPVFGSTDIFLARLDADGGHVFSRSFGSTANERAYGVAVAPGGELVMVGQLSGNAVDFGGGLLDAGGSSDAFVARFSADGVHQYSYRWGNPVAQLAKGVAIQSWPFISGQTVVVGEMAGLISLGSGTLASAGGLDVFMVNLDASGNALWGKRWGDTADQHVNAVAVDPLSGQIAITGSFSGTVDFGSGALVSDGGTDGYIAVFTPAMSGVSGTWSVRFGDGEDQEGRDIAFDYAGNVVTVGWFRGAMGLGGQQRTSGGGKDLFVAKHTAGGALVWLETAGDAADQELESVAVDSSNLIRVTGTLAGTTLLDQTPITSVGAQDVFVGELLP